MRLSELMAGDVTAENLNPDPEITGLSADSRTVVDGNLFAALPGRHDDGRRYILEAVKRGAAAVMAEEGTAREPAVTVPFIPVKNPRRRYAQLAARFYRRQPDTVAAVTGTNGKTSVVQFTRQLWARLGHKAGSVGTLGMQAPGVSIPGALTTPDPVALHQSLAEMAQLGVDRLAMEASSHGLDQHRLDGVAVKIAAFTNLSRDHLDYHGDFESYFLAKARLFTELLAEGGCAVLNADLPEFDTLTELCEARGLRILSFGRRGGTVRLCEARALARGTAVELEVDGRRHAITLPLIGAFQLANALCALTIVLAAGEQVETAIGALETLSGVRGRVEYIGRSPSGGAVYVDYAHTPDALATVLGALRPHCAGKLVCLFGAGGDRDAGKRPLMGRAAAEHADRVVLTDDNPRHEDPAAIRAAVAEGCPEAVEIGDRAQAIATAIAALAQDDVLVIAGKGHERGQIVGDEMLPFDDAEEARRHLTDGGATGP